MFIPYVIFFIDNVLIDKLRHISNLVTPTDHLFSIMETIPLTLLCRAFPCLWLRRNYTVGCVSVYYPYYDRYEVNTSFYYGLCFPFPSCH